MTSYSSIFSSEPSLSSGFSIARANRGPCPVCGHPTGDCTGPDGPDPLGPQIAGKGLANNNAEKEDMVWVAEDVIEEIEVSPYTTIRSIVAQGGSYISVEKAKEIGLA